MARQHMVQVGPCAGAAKFVLGEIGNFDPAHGLLYGFDFFGDIIVAAVAFKSGAFMGVLGTVGKP